jgi:hypothetical protein
MKNEVVMMEGLVFKIISLLYAFAEISPQSLDDKRKCGLSMIILQQYHVVQQSDQRGNLAIKLWSASDIFIPADSILENCNCLLFLLHLIGHPSVSLPEKYRIDNHSAICRIVLTDRH